MDGLVGFTSADFGAAVALRSSLLRADSETSANILQLDVDFGHTVGVFFAGNRVQFRTLFDKRITLINQRLVDGGEVQRFLVLFLRLAIGSFLQAKLLESRISTLLGRRTNVRFFGRSFRLFFGLLFLFFRVFFFFFFGVFLLLLFGVFFFFFFGLLFFLRRSLLLVLGRRSFFGLLFFVVIVGENAVFVVRVFQVEADQLITVDDSSVPPVGIIAAERVEIRGVVLAVRFVTENATKGAEAPANVVMHEPSNDSLTHLCLPSSVRWYYWSAGSAKRPALFVLNFAVKL